MARRRLAFLAAALGWQLTWVAPPAARRHAGLMLLLPAMRSEAEEIPPGNIPKGLMATALGEKVTTPNGVVYEPLELGTTEEGPRNGPPRGGSTVILRLKETSFSFILVRFSAHLDGFDGPIFDSSTLRGQRKPNKVDYVESRLNVEPLPL